MVRKFVLPKKNQLLIINLVSAVALVIAAGSAFYFYHQYKKTASQPKAVAEIESTASAVAKLIELPDENPTLATVSDVDKLKSQDFFKKAKNGDKVLIFKSAKKAILYRPSSNKIIEVGPIKVDETQASQVAGAATGSAQTISPTLEVSPTVEPTQTDTVSVVIWNGTKINGLTKKTSPQLTEKFPDIRIKDTGNAQKSDYTKTVVIDLKGTLKEKAQAISTFLKGEVGTMPKGESIPEADILVILGSS